MSEQTSPRDCKYWMSGCSAPLCPLESNLERAVWYPDEPICRATKFSQGKTWIAQQRKVAKQATRTDLFFDVAMLSRGFVVRKGIEGISPDSKDIEASFKRRFKEHPTRPEKSARGKETVRMGLRSGDS